MENFIHTNPVDTLDMLLNVESDRVYKDISYFKLWVKAVLEQQEDDYKETLSCIYDRLLKKYEKPRGDGDGEKIDEYIVAALLRYICMRESLKWENALKSLEDICGYVEYGKIDKAYVMYLFGRLFYDIQEYYEDLSHIMKEFTDSFSVIVPDIQSYFNYINKERIYRCVSVIAPNTDFIIQQDYFTVIDIINVAELFFDCAYKRNSREHYMAWLALTHQKKALYYLYKEWDNNGMVNSRDEFFKAISIYEQTIDSANKVITNLLFNTGLCYFYLENISIISSDKTKAFDNFSNAYNYFTKAMEAKDEAEVKSEYTFRRNPLDVYYYRLVAAFEIVKKYEEVDFEKIIINNGERLTMVKFSSLINDFSSLLKENKYEPYRRVEYYITMAEIYEYLNDINSNYYWKEAKKLDKEKFVYPYRIGLAFNDKRASAEWSFEINKIMEMIPDNSYESFQNSKIKDYFQNDARTNKENNEL